MKHTLLIIALFTIMFANAQPMLIGDNSKISERLQTAYFSNPNEWMEISILLSDRVDAEALRKQFDAANTPLNERSETVIRLLKQKAAETQPLLINELRNYASIDNSTIEKYWIVNMIKVRVKMSVIPILSNFSEIAYLDLNAPLALDEFTTESREERIEGFVAFEVRLRRFGEVHAIGAGEPTNQWPFQPGAPGPRRAVDHGRR